jgi:hypothetical protein
MYFFLAVGSNAAARLLAIRGGLSVRDLVMTSPTFLLEVQPTANSVIVGFASVPLPTNLSVASQELRTEKKPYVMQYMNPLPLSSTTVLMATPITEVGSEEGRRSL